MFLLQRTIPPFNARRSTARRLLLASLLGVVCSLSLAPHVHAQPAAASTSTNAALYYWRAWYSADRDFLKKLGDEYKSSDPDWKPSEELTKELASRQGQIGEITRATLIAPCDFGIAREDGYMALIPHVGLMRQSARFLGCDARRLWLAGKSDDAGHRLAAIVRMSAHTRSDRVAISSLVGNAVFALALDEAKAMTKGGAMTDAVKRSLAELIKPFDKEDPFNVREALDSERAMVGPYVKRRLESDGVEVLREIASVTDQSNQPLKDKIQSLTKEQALKDLEKVDQYFKEALAVWDAPDRDAKLKALAERNATGEFGVVGQVVLPSLVKLSENAHKARTTVKEFLALVK